MLLFAFVPVTAIDLIVLPIMIPLTVYVSYIRLRKVATPILHVPFAASTWTAIAVTFNYPFFVNAFGAQGYYDLDVLIYYALPFIIPTAVGAAWRASGKNSTDSRV